MMVYSMAEIFASQSLMSVGDDHVNPGRKVGDNVFVFPQTRFSCLISKEEGDEYVFDVLVEIPIDAKRVVFKLGPDN